VILIDWRELEYGVAALPLTSGTYVCFREI
jgi:hypothetical protein